WNQVPVGLHLFPPLGEQPHVALLGGPQAKDVDRLRELDGGPSLIVRRVIAIGLERLFRPHAGVNVGPRDRLSLEIEHLDAQRAFCRLRGLFLAPAKIRCDLASQHRQAEKKTRAQANRTSAEHLETSWRGADSVSLRLPAGAALERISFKRSGIRNAGS